MSRSGCLPLPVLQRVGVGHQVAAHPVGVDQLVHPGRLGDVVLVPGRDVPHPADRLVGDLERLEHLVPEAAVAEQQPVDVPQELAGLRALDDPVVIGRGQRDGLADRQPGHGLLGRALVGGRVLHRADADDAALAGHQPRHRVLGADRARVGQPDRGAGEVLDGQLAAAGPADHVLVGHPELAEVHALRGLDRGHQQLARPVLGRHVDGQAQVDVLRLDQRGLAVQLGVGVVHLRRRGQRADHREPDQVGERDLAAPAAGQVVVDHDAVVDQQLGRHRADAGRGGHGQAGGHVDRGAGGRAAQPGGARGRRRGRGGLGRLAGDGGRCWRRRGGRRSARGRGGRPGRGRRGGRRGRRGGGRLARLGRTSRRLRSVRLAAARAGPRARWQCPWAGCSRRRNSTRPCPPSRDRPGNAGRAHPPAIHWARSRWPRRRHARLPLRQDRWLRCGWLRGGPLPGRRASLR